MKFLHSMLTLVPVLAVGFSDLPSFDLQAALIVGAVVTLVAVGVIVIAIATPFVAIQAGATLVGTAIAIGAMALTTGLVGGTAAGIYWGHQGDIEREKDIDEIAALSNHMEISFIPSESDPERAANFECNLAILKEVDLNSRSLKVQKESIHLKGASANEFYLLVEQKLQQWFVTPVLADEARLPRRVSFYMTPNPGEGVYERLKNLVEEKATREVIVQRVDSSIKSGSPKEGK